MLRVSTGQHPLLNAGVLHAPAGPQEKMKAEERRQADPAAPCSSPRVRGGQGCSGHDVQGRWDTAAKAGQSLHFRAFGSRANHRSDSARALATRIPTEASGDRSAELSGVLLQMTPYGRSSAQAARCSLHSGACGGKGGREGNVEGDKTMENGLLRATGSPGRQPRPQGQ